METALQGLGLVTSRIRKLSYKWFSQVCSQIMGERGINISKFNCIRHINLVCRSLMFRKMTWWKTLLNRICWVMGEESFLNKKKLLLFGVRFVRLYKICLIWVLKLFQIVISKIDMILCVLLMLEIVFTEKLLVQLKLLKMTVPIKDIHYFKMHI